MTRDPVRGTIGPRISLSSPEIAIVPLLQPLSRNLPPRPPCLKRFFNPRVLINGFLSVYVHPVVLLRYGEAPYFIEHLQYESIPDATQETLPIESASAVGRSLSQLGDASRADL